MREMLIASGPFCKHAHLLIRIYEATFHIEHQTIIWPNAEGNTDHSRGGIVNKDNQKRNDEVAVDACGTRGDIR